MNTSFENLVLSNKKKITDILIEEIEDHPSS